MRQVFIVAVSSLLLFSSCREIFAKRIRGNGNITTQNRSAGQFNSIDVSGSINVYVKQDSTPSIKVEADDNLLQYIETVNDGDMLRIKTQEGYNINSSRGIKVYVSAATFKKFEASGACDIFSDGSIKTSSDIDIDLSGSCDATLDVNSPKIRADLSGACTVKLKGQTRDFDIQGSGSTSLKCYDLLAENVDLDISGAGDAQVYASVKLSGSISGAADVEYKGTAQTDIHTSGASSVKKVN
ncbi:MAG: head GIN domain-containing protein [Chitinophagales bacterium]